MNDQLSFARPNVPQGHLKIAGITRAWFTAGCPHRKHKSRRDGRIKLSGIALASKRVPQHGFGELLLAIPGKIMCAQSPVRDSAIRVAAFGRKPNSSIFHGLRHSAGMPVRWLGQAPFLPPKPPKLSLVK